MTVQRTTQADSSDNDSHVGISIDIVPPPAEPDIVISSDGNSDRSIADNSGTDNELSARPVSARPDLLLDTIVTNTIYPCLS